MVWLFATGEDGLKTFTSQVKAASVRISKSQKLGIQLGIQYDYVVGHKRLDLAAIVS